MHFAEPTDVNASGLHLRGIQFNYQTPYSLGANFTVAISITPDHRRAGSLCFSLAHHLEVFPGSNNLPSTISSVNTPDRILVPFPDFGFEAASANGRKQRLPWTADANRKTVRRRTELAG